MIRFILSLFVPFRWFIEKMGADYNQFIRILQLKLTLDNRRVKSFSNKPQNDQKNALIWQSLIQAFIGIFFGIFLSMVKTPFTFYYFSHLFIMVMMAMSIISEFTSILFDTSENAIIQPLPVKGNTISLARNAHVLIYLSLIAFSISVASIIVAFVKFGTLSGLIFVFTIFMNVLFTLFFANILYLGIFRLASGEKLKNLLMYFQVFIAILFMAGYQIGIRLVDKSNIMNMELPVHWYTYLVPPAFFSGFIEGLSGTNWDVTHLIFIAEALIIPVVAIYITGKHLTPVFNRKLADLELGDRTSKVKAESTGKSILYRIMSSVFVHEKDEKAAFSLMWKMTGRERLFKQTLLPSYGYFVIMMLLPFLSNPGKLSNISESDNYLFILYFSVAIVSTLPRAMLIGTNRNAAWIFKSIPLETPAGFFKGSIKAAFSKFFIPFYIVVVIGICIIWGIRILPDAIIAFLVIYLFALVTYYIQNPIFPFASDKSAAQAGGDNFKLFLFLIAGAGFAFLHKFLIHWFPLANLILIPVYAGLIYYVNRVMVYRKIRWKVVDRVNVY
jgi:ABC-2 type transport system permease protein